MVLSSSSQLCNEVSTRRPINGFMERIRLIEQFNAIPIVVFDGARIPSKAATNLKRERERLKFLDVAKDHDKNEDMELAMKSYKRAFSKAPLVSKLIKGDAHHAYMFRKGMIDVAISDDTDLIPYEISWISFLLFTSLF
ncbi:exonuclease 1 [Tanacetum coccineum]